MLKAKTILIISLFFFIFPFSVSAILPDNENNFVANTTVITSSFMNYIQDAIGTSTSWLLNKLGDTTDDITEGSTNLFFTNARARAMLSSTATGLTYTSATGDFSLTSGYEIPLISSSTNWSNFYYTPSNRITDGTGLTWSGNTLNCDMASGSTQGCLSSANWTTFNNKQNAFTSIAGLNTSFSGESVASTTATLTGDVGGNLGATVIGATTIHDSMIDFGAGANQVNTADVTELTNLYYTDARVNSYIHGSSTIPKLYTNNTFTGLQQFNGNASTTAFTNSGDTWFTSLATPAGTFLAVDNNGKLIATSTPSGGTGTPGGSDGQIQYNNGGAFGGDAGLFYDDVNGYVGIGTTTPDSRLTINDNGSSGYYVANIIQDDEFIPALSIRNKTYTTNQAKTFTFWQDDTGIGKIRNNGQSTGLNFNLNGYMNTLANFGVASSSPWALLSVTNTGSIPSMIVEDDTSPDTSPFIIDAAGNVGIGTTTPFRKLSVIDGTGNQLMLSYNTANYTNFSVGATGILTVSNNSNAFDYSGLLRTIGSTGGIGITRRDTSANAFGLYSAAGNLSFYDYAGTAGDRMTIQSNTGNVGFGTTTPASKIDVYGAAAIDSGTTATSTIEGNSRICNDTCSQGMYLTYPSSATTSLVFF